MKEEVKVSECLSILLSYHLGYKVNPNIDFISFFRFNPQLLSVIKSLIIELSNIEIQFKDYPSFMSFIAGNRAAFIKASCCIQVRLARINLGYMFLNFYKIFFGYNIPSIFHEWRQLRYLVHLESEFLDFFKSKIFLVKGFNKMLIELDIGKDFRINLEKSILHGRFFNFIDSHERELLFLLKKVKKIGGYRLKNKKIINNLNCYLNKLKTTRNNYHNLCRRYYLSSCKDILWIKIQIYLKALYNKFLIINYQLNKLGSYGYNFFDHCELDVFNFSISIISRFIWLEKNISPQLFFSHIITFRSHVDFCEICLKDIKILMLNFESLADRNPGVRVKTLFRH